MDDSEAEIRMRWSRQISNLVMTGCMLHVEGGRRLLSAAVQGGSKAGRPLGQENIGLICFLLILKAAKPSFRGKGWECLCYCMFRIFLPTSVSRHSLTQLDT